MSKRFAAIISLLIGAGLIIYPREVGTAVQSALVNCASVVIPSLFPFMALCGFIALADLGKILTKPLSPILKWLYGLPPEMGGLVLSGFVGGYPVAACAMAGMIDQKRMHPETASRLLPLCSNAGPAFVISIAGAAVLGSTEAGALLWIGQFVSALITGYIFLRKDRCNRKFSQSSKGLALAPALVKGVCDASVSMLYICGFYIVFTALISVLTASGFYDILVNAASRAVFGLISAEATGALLQGSLEVVSGCMAASQLTATEGVIIVPFLLGFSSLSVFCQVASCLHGRQVDLRPFAISRLIHAVITTVIAAPLIKYFTPVADAFSHNGIAAFPVNSGTVVGSLCIIAMCSIILLSVEGISMKLFKYKP